VSVLNKPNVAQKLKIQQAISLVENKLDLNSFKNSPRDNQALNIFEPATGQT
jgi:hypothetical protein